MNTRATMALRSPTFNGITASTRSGTLNKGVEVRIPNKKYKARDHRQALQLAQNQA
ncbi:hypothetical protein BAUCODRAFT_35022 [Baudoinia panamericana UAMH 10762]|uniref:Uncharacterized protein n=1 Tax=Baudoinia panamericana (strain UAMH 10762) TaxID=717646 RepID=M2LL91_BAUPA|nr:uncharacterized protein BAUCODRAFT_35022 [Baudoinia panamericana UAMH 10762]EMC95027.1 hypothetical protein BAUCODRAFT_35022 [Baudoinia panamericana UAMH 10762]